jgi:3-hydroxybutyryl-CoA dehydrogenase
MKLVEVVRGEQTTDSVVETLVQFTKAVQKTPVVCTDAPGFIVNRVARPYYIEALRLVEAQQVGIETADRLLEGAGFKLGPFRLMDLIGNDVNYAVSCSVYEQLESPNGCARRRCKKKKWTAARLEKKQARVTTPIEQPSNLKLFQTPIHGFYYWRHRVYRGRIS